MIKDAIKAMCDKIKVKDFRQQGKVRYRLVPTLIGLLLAWMAGANSSIKAAAYWEDNLKILQELIPGFPKHNISHDTINRLLSLIRVDDLNGMLREFCQMIYQARGLDEAKETFRILSLDGQTPRALEYEHQKGFLGHKNDDKRLHNKLYYVTLYDSTGGLALSQEEVCDKENENKACVRLINLFDLNGCMVTADALNTQRSVAGAVIDNGGDYTLALKKNHKGLCQKVEALFKNKELVSEYGQEYAPATELSHGRIEERKVIALPSSLLKGRDLGAWKEDCNTLYMAVTRSIDKKHQVERTPEIRFFISSLSFETDRIAEHGYRTIRKHWGIENSLHWCLDMDFGQDRMQVKNRNYCRNIMVMNKISLNLLRHLQKIYKHGKENYSVPCLQIFMHKPEKMLPMIGKLVAEGAIENEA